MRNVKWLANNEEFSDRNWPMEFPNKTTIGKMKEYNRVNYLLIAR